MSKTTKGKDTHGIFHPGKGKPSGANKEEGLGLQATQPDEMDEYKEINDKYIVSADKIDPSVHVRHVNRNTSKGEDDDNTGETRVKQ